MAFYPTPFGHAEIHIDRRDPQPPRYAASIVRQRRRQEGRRDR